MILKFREKLIAILNFTKAFVEIAKVFSINYLKQKQYLIN